jgi:ribosomal protein L11 methyltransferase
VTRRWLRAEIRPELGDGSSEEWAAACMEALAPIGCLGTEELGAAEAMAIVAWLPGDADAREIEPLLAREGLAGRVAATTIVEDPGWVEQFNASLRPIEVGRRLVILPRPGPVPEGRVAIVIEPGRAFGTGHHESTRLALEHLERELKPGDSVLDVGTGSGILALAAVRLGAARAVGIDVDPEAIEVARENVEGQPESSRIRLMTCGDPALVEGRFDMVLANITVDVLLAMLPALVAKLAPTGRLVLAGLLERDRAAMDEGLAKQGLSASWAAEGEWISACAASR